jgi:hypothetical protein
MIAKPLQKRSGFLIGGGFMFENKKTISKPPP